MRNFLKSLMTVLAALGSIAVVWMTIASPAGQTTAYRAPRTADGKPNLNGIWQAVGTAHWDVQTHAARPAQAVVPGPIPNSLLPAAPVLALGARGGVPGGMGVVEGEEIPYRPEMLARKKENFDNALTRDPEVKCYLPGIPRATYMPYPFQIAQSTNKIMMIYEFSSGTRTINLDKTPPPPVESWMGYSVARWEGDTLVVDVTNQVEQTWFDRAGNFHSDELHVIERYTPVSPDHLDYEVTIDDPKVFTRQWKMRMPLYRRLDKNVQLIEYKCVEFVEELMYGHLRKQQLVGRWQEDLGEFGGKITFDVTRQASE
jgi:hypothetical protein